jgi:hydrogenase maturation protein HypF
VTVRVAVRVTGIVQGVGFRPFVYALAGRHRLGGHVGNDPAGVFIEVEGPAEDVGAFVAALSTEAPPLASVDSVEVRDIAPAGTAGFAIVASDAAGERATLVSADSATCDDCLREMDDPADRRYGYPFINCVNCGPRFTIVRDVPYDRPATTMAPFAMCGACAAEYHDPADRRFHAQPTCCPDCGPALRSVPGGGVPLDAAAALLRGGGVLAVKGLGGFHLAVLAADEGAAARLRARKHREDKPFAVMVADLDAARALGEVDDVAAGLLTGRARPIVLCDKRPGAAVAAAVAPGNRQLGLMLPYTPLHHLLLRRVGEPIVLTSGNVSDEPIAFDDADAAARLAPIADGFLSHDRAIHIRVDDSVVRAFRGAPVALRRSRGYAPEPIRLAFDAARPVLGCGAELKNTFCLAKGRHAFVSHHIGDLENYPTLRSYTDGIAHLSRLFDVTPTLIAHDLHPEYLSTKWALDQGRPLLGVQHHHAHIASCLADNGRAGPVIGVAFDGTGYGPDGTIWGGELLVASLSSYRRVGHLSVVPMPGGAAAIRQPWRMAVSWLAASFDGDPPPLAVLDRNPSWRQVAVLGARGVNAPLTSSAGRLLDAVSALIGLRDAITYEGQAAIELEQAASTSPQGAYPVGVAGGVIAGEDLIRAVVDDMARGVAVPVIAARVHAGLGDAVVRACEAVRDDTGLAAVALSGGVFQNLLLLDRVVGGLSARGFEVLTHHRVPANDGGISLGQVAVAAAQ